MLNFYLAKYFQRKIYLLIKNLLDFYLYFASMEEILSSVVRLSLTVGADGKEREMKVIKKLIKGEFYKVVD